MIRTLCFIALAVSAAALFLPAVANPLSQIKQAANQGRDAAEEHSEKVAEQAEHAAVHKDHDHHAAADHDDEGENVVEINRAVAIMLPTEGNAVRGVIRFEQTALGVAVTARVSGLNPNHKHGFHIHEFGDISDPAGKATGGHYNPGGHDHALPEKPGSSRAGVRHAGDLGNLQADDKGNATFAMTFDNISIFDDDHNPILGRGVIIHAQPDDGGQPTGNAGARIAQGVIGVAKPR